MKIILKGRVPSKKNSRQIVFGGNRPYSIPSKEYRFWHEEQSYLLPKVKKPLKLQCIELFFYAPDKRKADLSNKTESVMDLLVDNKIIEDDNWFEVASLNLRFKGVDKDNPRVEINIL